MHKQMEPRLFPAAAEIKFLLDFFTKKSRVQGRALPLPAQGRVQGGVLPLPAQGRVQGRALPRLGGKFFSGAYFFSEVDDIKSEGGFGKCQRVSDRT